MNISAATAEPPRDRPDDHAVTAAVLLIGDELLSGQTRDVNLSWIAPFLNDLGIQTIAVEIVPDRHQAIIDALGRLTKRCDYVISTGGIGPTHDDITAEAVAMFFKTPLSVHEEARRRMDQHYGPGGLTEARLRMARIPEGAELIDNPVSVAPGFTLGTVFVLAGVPNIMQAMLTGAARRFQGGQKMLVTGVFAELGESRFSRALEQLQDEFPQTSLGSYPIYRLDGTFATRLIARDRHRERLAQVEARLMAIVEAEGIKPRLLSEQDILGS